jgi:hypothetical protein
MARLLQSMYSDPIASAIKTFSTLDDIMGRHEDRATRRELMAENLADRRLQAERQKDADAWQKKVQADTEKGWGKRDEVAFDTRMAQRLASASEKLRSNKDLDEDEEMAYLAASNHALNWKDLSTDQLDGVHKSIRSLRDGLTKIGPALQQAIQSGKGGTISREQAPELFDAFDAVYGDQINKGTDRTGKPAQEKKIDKIFIDPKDQTLVAQLRVKDADGKEYYAPMTADRGNDPNAAVLKLPIPLFIADMQAKINFADGLDLLRMKYGDKELTKKREEARETMKQSEAYRAGELAVMDALGKNRTAGVNELRAAGSKALRDKAKELGIAVPEKDITAWTKEFVAEKEQRPRAEEQLTEDALRGDKEAQSILDNMQKRKVTIARESRPPKEPKDKEDKATAPTTIDRRLKDLNKRFDDMAADKKELTPGQKRKAKDAVREGSDVDEAIEKATKGKAETPMMPLAEDNKDRTIRDTVTGKRYKSDGKKWVEIH